MKIILERVENGWTIETRPSPETPTRTMRIAKDTKELMRILKYILALPNTKEPQP